MRIAWFSPWPPVRTGIATCSAELVPALRERHEIDVFANRQGPFPETRPAHEFVWRHRLAPYDLTVYQVGNSSHHDYVWPYVFRYPGLTVLHDAHLHHARAAAHLQAHHPHAYRAEFRANHPEENADAAELAIAGFDSHLYYMWPMTRLVVERSKLTVVHSRPMAAQLSEELGAARIEHVRLSQGTIVNEDREQAARQRVRARYAIAPDAITFGCFGGLSPEKRVPQILDAFTAVLPYVADLRLLLGGGSADHYDVARDVRSRGLQDRVVLTGYLDSEDELTDVIAAVDVTLNLRWPTAREISGPWLRALAAGKPSIVTDLFQTIDVPMLDPRTWTCKCLRPEGGAGLPAEPPIAVAVDILDEDHSLRLAMRRLSEDAILRGELGEAARRHWRQEHSPDAMRADYERVMATAHTKPSPAPMLPAHLRDEGTWLLERLVKPFGLPTPLG